MFKKFFQYRQVHPFAFLAAGTVFALVAVSLTVAHVSTISSVSTISVPLVASVPKLERRLNILKEQVELSALQTATRTGVQQEKIEVYALPKRTDVSRLIATFEVIRDVLARNDLLSSMSDVTISDPQDNSGDGVYRTVSVEFTAHEQGVKTILLLVRLSGLLSVGDVLLDKERELLLHRIEQESPAGIISLEQFLSVDLLRYIEEPKTFEQQLKRSFSTDNFRNTLDHVIQTSLLHDAKILLGSDIGEVLQSFKLWPLQIMAIEEASLRPGSAPKWYKLGLTVRVFSEES